jgi:hypothetical protein
MNEYGIDDQAQFISEPVMPDAGTFDAASLARGEPGLPTGFTWRGTHYAITDCLESWKESVAENHAPGGERYYRKRFFRVRVSSGEIMTLYCLRHTGPSAGAQKKRWWLYTIDARDEERCV